MAANATAAAEKAVQRHAPAVSTKPVTRHNCTGSTLSRNAFPDTSERVSPDQQRRAYRPDPGPGPPSVAPDIRRRPEPRSPGGNAERSEEEPADRRHRGYLSHRSDEGQSESGHRPRIRQAGGVRASASDSAAIPAATIPASTRPR